MGFSRWPEIEEAAERAVVGRRAAAAAAARGRGEGRAHHTRSAAANFAMCVLACLSVCHGTDALKRAGACVVNRVSEEEGAGQGGAHTHKRGFIHSFSKQSSKSKASEKEGGRTPSKQSPKWGPPLSQFRAAPKARRGPLQRGKPSTKTNRSNNTWSERGGQKGKEKKEKARLWSEDARSIDNRSTFLQKKKVDRSIIGMLAPRLAHPIALAPWRGVRPHRVRVRFRDSCRIPPPRVLTCLRGRGQAMQMPRRLGEPISDPSRLVAGRPPLSFSHPGSAILFNVIIYIFIRRQKSGLSVRTRQQRPPCCRCRISDVALLSNSPAQPGPVSRRVGRLPPRSPCFGAAGHQSIGGNPRTLVFPIPP